MKANNLPNLYFSKEGKNWILLSCTDFCECLDKWKVKEAEAEGFEHYLGPTFKRAGESKKRRSDGSRVFEKVRSRSHVWQNYIGQYERNAIATSYDKKCRSRRRRIYIDSRVYYENKILTASHREIPLI